MTTCTNESRVHVRYDGQSHDFALSALDVGPGSTDQEIKERVAFRLNIDAKALAAYEVDRPETGNITLRPEAVWG